MGIERTVTDFSRDHNCAMGAELRRSAIKLLGLVVSVGAQIIDAEGGLKIACPSRAVLALGPDGTAYRNPRRRPGNKVPDSTQARKGQSKKIGSQVTRSRRCT